jgi:ABC-type bacteriocin/lantibiotic exporter with double-glycine peptidase domain
MAKRRGVKVVAQKHDFDCGVAALAMLLGLPYGDVAAACRELYGSTKPTKRGLGIYHLEAIAEQLGRRLRRVYKRKDYLNDQTGVLGMLGGDMCWAGHWVVLKAGAIVDPDGGTVWHAGDYVKRHNTRPCTLLVEA